MKRQLVQNRRNLFFFHNTSTFDRTQYKRSLQAIQPTAVTTEYASFVNAKVAAEEDGVWTTGKVQCLFQGIQFSMTRPLPADSILPNKSQPFSIVWADNTDSICDLQCLLTYMDNHANKRHKVDATQSSTTNRSLVRLLMVRQPLPPSRPGDLVDSLRRSGSFAFLSELFDTERLFELRDFRIARVMPKGEAVEQFAASMHLVLDLADQYPRDPLAAHILDRVAQFLPALLCPCTRRGRVMQIISSAKRFQRGDWKGGKLLCV